ncbi:MAG: acetamidase/formamidase family protein [Candidatus Bipolaricaulaceae bacterium]
MHTIPWRDHVYTLAPRMQAAATVHPDQVVTFETQDAFGGQIQSEDDHLADVDFSRINPATGPVRVVGAEPGDTLALHFRHIRLPEQGAIVAGHGMGVLGQELEGTVTKILPIRDGTVVFDQLSLPCRPMVGVVGVAPHDQPFPTGTAHRHGGNMDAKEIGEGATLYLPVFQPGALVAMGDVHALMGDGEVAVSACEVAAQVTVQVRLLKGVSLPWPAVEREEGLYLLVSLPTIDEALVEATRAAVDLLARRRHLSRPTATLLASLTVDLGISQLVDPNKTAKAFLPRRIIGDRPL